MLQRGVVDLKFGGILRMGCMWKKTCQSASRVSLVRDNHRFHWKGERALGKGNGKRYLYEGRVFCLLNGYQMYKRLFGLYGFPNAFLFDRALHRCIVREGLCSQWRLENGVCHKNR